MRIQSNNYRPDLDCWKELGFGKGHEAEWEQWKLDNCPVVHLDGQDAIAKALELLPA